MAFLDIVAIGGPNQDKRLALERAAGLLFLKTTELKMMMQQLNQEKKAPRSGAYRSKPIVAVRPDGQVAGSFDSVISACRLFGFGYNSIIAHLNRRSASETFHGLKWFYEKDYRQMWLDGKADDIRFEVNAIFDHHSGHFKRKENGGGDSWAAIRTNDPERYAAFIARKRSSTRQRWASGRYAAVCRKVRCIEDGRVFSSLRGAGRYYGLTANGVRNLANTGRAGTYAAKGLHFEFVAEADVNQIIKQEKN